MVDAELERRLQESAGAYLRGDVDRYLELIHHSDDYTLMSPHGGELVRGFDTSPETLQATREFFRGGEASVDIEQTYESGDLTVIVAVERQHGKIGGLPDQDLSLRVTLVFRRTQAGWDLVHRHADPLVHPIGVNELAELARGTAVAG
ncbi:nuclear transport factor 2 family protein [Kribbella sp. NPDC051952]|uniref:YybH family protein n=1 Tax=Kribbella sp. NPDC051952 TaxID=3154851 RepID=UPI0034186053